MLLIFLLKFILFINCMVVMAVILASTLVLNPENDLA